MAGKDWTDEEIRAEIGAAVKMVAEDKEKIEYQRLHGKFGTTTPPKDGPQPPPQKDDPTPEPEKKRRSIWWGEATEEPEKDK